MFCKNTLKKHDYKNHCDDEYGDDYIGRGSKRLGREAKYTEGLLCVLWRTLVLALGTAVSGVSPGYWLRF